MVGFCQSQFSCSPYCLAHKHNRNIIISQQNGGHSNAYTDMDHTNYFFSVLPPFLEGTCMMMEIGRREAVSLIPVFFQFRCATI